MKTIYFLLIIAISGCIRAQQKITDVDLEQFIGKKVEYCDKVYGTYVSSGNNKVALLNLGADYPDNLLTVAIFESNWKKFDYRPEEFLLGKIICVSGKLILYKGKPEIIVSKPEQIKLK
jgi:micrococcal nuclease